MKKNNHNAKSQTAKKKHTQPALEEVAAPAAAMSMRFSLGALFLFVAIGACVILALDHFDLTRAPGCGPQSGCDLATRGPWGKIPGLNWPLSLVGVAFFTALLAGWISSRGTTTTAFRGFAMLGALGALFFLGVMIIGGYLCKYCLATHLANFAFVVVALWSPRVDAAGAARAQKREFIAALSAFAIATAALAVVNWQTTDIRLKRDEAELKRTVGDIITKSTDTSTNSTTSDGAAVHAPEGGFTGLWREGPEKAPIRIVIFGDFQCEDCYDIEVQVRQVLAKRNDVSVSAKHFPMNTECNPYMPRTLHSNACWAARASEAAGILRGNDGFWEMHHWLFDRRGGFTDAEIESAVRGFDYDWPQFKTVMMGPETEQRVRADVEEGRSLGLFFTPMVFINGVELRGFIKNPTALIRAVDTVAASNPPVGTALDDRPPLAPMKGVGDWLNERVVSIPARAQGTPEWSVGPSDARTFIWVWTDYQSPSARDFDLEIRRLLNERKDVRVVFRHYPMDQSCNPNMPRTISNAGCWGARAAEAAGRIGGNEGYWRVHQWLFDNQKSFNDVALRAAAPSLGFNADELIAEMISPRVQTAVSYDANAGKLMITRGIPTVYVNGKWVARWKIGEANVLDLIVKHTAGELKQ